MEDYYNPFPPIGIRRIWSRKYLENRNHVLSKLIHSMTWTKLGKLAQVRVDTLKEFPGLYAFVVDYPNLACLPIEQREVVYVGKSAGNVKKRLKSYLSDKKEIKKLFTSKKSVRDNIRILFDEYSPEIDVYYTEIPPDLVASIEDVLIQIFDPILNSSQRLDEEYFFNYESALSAKYDSPEEAFDESTSSIDEPEVADLEHDLASFLEPAEDAF